jgi:hypothetical protein
VCVAVSCLQTAKRSFTFARRGSARYEPCGCLVSKPLSGRSLLQEKEVLDMKSMFLSVSKPLSGRSLLQGVEELKRAGYVSCLQTAKRSFTFARNLKGGA